MKRILEMKSEWLRKITVRLVAVWGGAAKLGCGLFFFFLIAGGLREKRWVERAAVRPLSAGPALAEESMIFNSHKAAL